MAAPHAHHDHAAVTTNPIKTAIGITLAAVAVIVAIILLAQFAVGAYGSRVRKDDPAMSPQAVAKRLAPVAQVAVDPNAPAAAPAAPASPASTPPAAAPAAAPAKAADAGAAGKATYDTTCGVCHNAGVAGAPKMGDAAAWAPRLKAGKDAVYANAIKGKGAMPPKGGNAALSDDAVKAAVDYVLAQSK